MNLFNKILLLFTIVAITSTLQAQNNENFSIHIIDYSNSFEYDTHYVFDNEELQVYTESKSYPGQKQDVLIHRQLLGKEKRKIEQYLSLLSMLNFNKEYTDITNKYTGERNQKRIKFNYDNKTVNTLVSNTYQEDLANFVHFLNRYIKNPDLRMLEFSEPQTRL